MTAARFITGLSLVAAVLIVLTTVGCWALWTQLHQTVVWIMLAEAAVYAFAAWFALRNERVVDPRCARRAVVLILTVAALARIAIIFPPPVSTDIYRYVWDGRVEGAGINPYQYVPADPKLAFLRDEAIYPNINRATTAVTIYPPAAQMIFFGVTRMAETVTAMKAAMAGFDILGIVALLALLRRRGLPETRVLLYAWHPLPLFEFAGSGHIDAAAIALMLVATAAADRRHRALAGAVLAGAALVKYFPAVIAPALYRRWDWRFPAAAILVAVLLYLPYIGLGWRVLGYLPGYAKEEDLIAGSGFFLLAAISKFVALPDWATRAYGFVGGALLAAVALAVVFRRTPQAVAIVSALVLVVLFTLFLSPHFAWYFTWAIPFLCFRLSAALIYLTGAAPLLYDVIWSPGDVALNAALYLPFIFLLAIETIAGLRRPATEALDDGNRLDHGHAA